MAVTFLLGLIVAAYRSADSALTSLTTSFCVDFLNIDNKPKPVQKRMRKRIHILMSMILIVVIIIFRLILNKNVIDSLSTVASYTYGPLLDLFTFGIFKNLKIKDKYVRIVALTSVIIVVLITEIPSEIIRGYVIGYELLPVNGLLTFIGLWLISKKPKITSWLTILKYKQHQQLYFHFVISHKIQGFLYRG